MLNEGKRTELLFFLREIVLEAGVSDKLAEPFMASLAAKGARESVDSAIQFLAVSYTHLTLPTILRV